MHKIVHTNFQFDLSSYKITTIEENYWFSDKFFTKFSFPFNFELTEELIKIFGDLLDDNAKFIDTFYEVKYAFGNKLENAIFEIESQVGTKITATFRYGFDELPNFDKKLSELDLLNIEVTDIYEHARDVIFDNDNSIGYTFPQIHTDKYNDDTPTFDTFKKIINNYRYLDDLDPEVPGLDIVAEFYKNTHTVSDFANRNIIQPCVFFRYILKVGFEMAGYELKGDILDSTLFDGLLLITDVDYFKRESTFKQEILITPPNHDSITAEGLYYYIMEVPLEPSKKYEIKGIYDFYRKNAFFTNNSFFEITYKSAILKKTSGIKGSKKVRGNVSVVFTTNSDVSDQILVIKCYDYLPSLISSNLPDVFKGEIKEVISLTEVEPDKIINENVVNLKKAVPDIIFGEFVTICKNWFNLEFTFTGNEVFANFIELQLGYQNSFDLSEKEVLKPSRNFNKKDSFLLKFKDISSEEFLFEPVFINKTTERNDELEVNELTKKIEINAIPLPNINREGVDTSYCFENGGNQTLYAILYYGLSQPITGLNVTINPDPLYLSNIYNNYYKKWFEFRLNAIRYTWDFKMYLEDLLKIDKKIFAYGRYHIVKSLDKTQLSEDLFDIQIETETLP